jgi:RNA polymerase sigma-70 factor (ECF subfamily)
MKDKQKIFETKTGLKFDQYYLQTIKKLDYWLTQFNRNKNDRDEIISDTFINVLMYIDGYDPQYNINTWVYHIAKNISVRKTNLKKRRNEFFYQQDDGVELQIPYFENNEQEKFNEDVSKCILIKDLIEELPEIYRTCMRMRHVQGMDYASIKEELNLNLSTVKNRIKKGRELIKRKYNILNKKYNKK